MLINLHTMSRKSKKTKRYRKGWPEALVFIFLVNTMPYLPLPVIRFFSNCLFFSLYPIVGILSGLERRFRKNIEETYQGSLSKKEIRAIARKALYNQFIGEIEVTHYFHPRRRADLLKNVRLEGIEKVNEAKKDGVGAIGITAHISNFQLIPVRLSLEDINFWFLVRDPKTRALTEAWYRYMDRINLKKINFTDRSTAIKGVIGVLKQSGFIMMLADEYKRNGIKVDFFGRPTYMAAGPAVISLRTGATLLPMFIVREKKSKYKIIFDEPIEHHPTGDTEKDILDLTQIRTDLLEKLVRRYPDQWLWLHSRWGKRKRFKKLKKFEQHFRSDK